MYLYIYRRSDGVNLEVLSSGVRDSKSSDYDSTFTVDVLSFFMLDVQGLQCIVKQCVTALMILI